MAKAKIPKLICWELLQLGAVSETGMNTKVDIWNKGYVRV